MFFKCYYHPKQPGVHTCSGCKMPLCEPCNEKNGVCRDCFRKRGAVEDLRLMRRATAAKVRVASSTTARLRLALKQVGPMARRMRGGVDWNKTGLLATAPLPNLAWQHEALPLDARSARSFQKTLADRKGHWTYDPDRVAYRPQPVKTLNPVSYREPATPWKGWLASFFTGIVLSALIWVLSYIIPAVLKGEPAKLPIGAISAKSHAKTR